MGQGRRRHLLLATAPVLAAALVLAGCGGSSEETGAGDTTGVTDTAIKIGSHYPLTGPAAPGYGEIGPAAKAYFDHVNAEGGVDGRKIDFVYQDDAYNPATTVQVVRKLVLQDKVFAVMGGLGTPTHTKVVDFLNQNKVPDLFVASGCLCWNEPKEHPYTYAWQPDYTTEGKVLGKYLKENFAGKKIAFFYQDDDFGADGMKGVDEFVDPAQVVTRQAYQPGNTDIAPQIAALAGAKPDVVVSFSIPAYTALLRLGLLKVGATPQLVVSSVGSDPVTLGGLLEAYAKQGGAEVTAAPLLEGMITDQYLPAYLGPEAESNQWIKEFKQIHDEALPNTPFSGNTVYGMAQARTLVDLLKKTGKDLTREKLLSTLEAGGLTDGPGLVPFGYSKDSHEGYTGVQVVKLTGGIPVPQGDPQVP